jgi:intracellular sulfur oxidation DsrE/DsrF family protein
MNFGNIWGYALVLSLWTGDIALADQQAVNELLSRDEAPAGVVFEVIAGADGLRWAIPQIQHYSTQLRERFADLPIAVVTHGGEQFALQTSEQGEYAEVHATVRSLVGEQDIPIHVCETHASWRGVDPEDFPDYVDVTPAGPAQINDYQALGYELVMVERD